MRHIKTLAYLIALLLLLLITSCGDDEAEMACSTDNDCPASHYCAKSGGVFFAASHCQKRSDYTELQDTAYDDTSSTAHRDTEIFDAQPEQDGSAPSADTEVDTDIDSVSDVDSISDANADATEQPDIDTPPECTDDTQCDDNISCTTDACVDGLCQHIPDDSQCDDGNVCTDNFCDTALGCQTKNNNAPCDDGIFCNGADMCADGTCSFHQGTTCPDGICNEALKNCTECSNDNECGEAMAPVTSPCAFDSVCESKGTRTVTTRIPRCVNNSCTIKENVVTESCTRPMPTQPCAQSMESTWSSCKPIDLNVCTTQGEQARTVTVFSCSDNKCKSTNTTEHKACPLTPPDTCAPSKSSWGPCMNSNECHESGIQHKSVTSYTCSNGTCVASTTHNLETRGCTRQTNGNACSTGGNSGTCINGCCDTPCPPGPQCIQCLKQ